ncbi:hypothetical protein EVAR_70671_1 [Eumeta japonica]|uniref:Uncharacterized protein n=1 Tax=Eumeta variegata TaxID=151549 RepID=A0A4C1TFY7_EUMVA|nr:hypothetical protein EVAR_70671_1 [Eumeta japonica]
MEPEGKHRNFIMNQRILAVLGLVEIVFRCTLTTNNFQGLINQPEGSRGGSESQGRPSSSGAILISDAGKIMREL